MTPLLQDNEYFEGNQSQLKKKAYELALRILQAIKEATADGYGFSSPLDMNVFVGSESGRHRSVVLCEFAAASLRGLLRKNEGNIITQSVSVSTRHRDVDQKQGKNT